MVLVIFCHISLHACHLTFVPPLQIQPYYQIVPKLLSTNHGIPSTNQQGCLPQSREGALTTPKIFANMMISSSHSQHFFTIVYLILQDLSRTVSREVSKMDTCLAPAVYGYRPVTSSGGAFGSTVTTSQRANTTEVLKRVDIGFKKNAGLFHEF